MNWKKQYNHWIDYPNLENNLRKQLSQMTSQALEEAFYTDLQFGTGGMRGEVGPGTNRMNIYTIRKANVGFAQYLSNHFPNSQDRGIVIAYDNRHFSSEFAIESAKVMATYGIKTYLFDGIRPTPELSFAVRHLNAIGGIVVTASHNPPQYNGYKIYDENGCQLVPHLADEVIKNVNNIQNIFSIHIEEEKDLRNKGLIVTIGKAVDDAYIEKVKGIQLNKDMDKSNIKIVFTPLHGTANIPAQRVLSECGYSQVYPVKSQCVPDPNFSTVKFPNPEDGDAFQLAIEQGELVDADILIATDPDADRVGLAVKNHQNEYILLTGNQTGAILLSYILSQRKQQGTLPNKGVVFNTIVTSSFGAEIAKKYGLEVESTLTGFKFIGEKAKEIENTDKTFVFGYEESYGYLIADFVRDKDSIQSVLMCCEAANYYKQQNKTLYDVLLELYEEYGYYIESLVNISLKGIEGQEKIKQILTDFRQNRPENVSGQKVIVVEDYLEGKRYDTNGISLLTLPKSNVIKFTLEDGSWFVLRPSGTEPKLKIYVGVTSEDKQESENKNNQIKQYVLDRIEKLS
ncbi:phospho-sugar mutase [Mycoplasmatota bacterium]|nr:phospho-sugar mutase [Mycoplasmatota bacterium]